MVVVVGGGWSLSVFVVGRLVAVRALRPGDVAACLLMRMVLTVLTVLVHPTVLPVLVDLVVLVFLVFLVVLVVLVVLVLLVVLVGPAVPLTHVVLRCFRLCLPLLLR
jgi:hypothetical protein